MKKGIFNTILILLLALTVNAQVPVADFSGSVLSGCAPLRVNFKDLSSGDPKYWDWDLDNGQLSNVQNPAATYSVPGTYTITLVARNQNGVNAVTKTSYITVFPSPVVSFSANITTACLPAAIQFTGNATTTVGTITEWLWDFGDGTTSNQQNPQHIYAETGYYNVSLTVTSSNGCIGRRGVSRYIRMVSGIAADFVNTPSTECNAPFNVSFSNESSGPGTLTYTWDFGNGDMSTGDNPVATYTSANSYPVKLITQSSYGCRDTVEKTVPVTAFNTSFTIPDTACVNQQINFQNASAAGTTFMIWDFGDGTQSQEFSPVKTYTTPGTYTVKLLNRFANCTDSLIKSIIITQPVVDFTATNNTGCEAPLTVNFQSIFSNAVTWQWDFGDGQTADIQNPVHEYLDAGKFTVTLTVTTATGCQVSVTKPNFVNITPPTINIANLPDALCLGNLVSPVATASSPDGIVSYSWDFGDGTPLVSGASPTHNYAAIGVYTITLTVTTGGGCAKPVTRQIKVGTAPNTIDFAVELYGPCVSDTVKFSASANGANEWLWDFGDGQTSSLQYPHHIYMDTGKLTVTLIALNNGCAALPLIKTDFITKVPPVAKFGFSIDCDNRLNVNFSDSSLVDSTLLPLSYLWDFGDGQTSTLKDPGLHSYAAINQYTTTLTVINVACTSVVIKPVNLTPFSADFTVPKTRFCINEPISFAAVEDSANVSSYVWTIDGGSPIATTKIFNTKFSAAKTYTITLEVTDNGNCKKTTTQTIVVDAPVAQFTASDFSICGTGTVTFTDQSTSGTSIKEWIWDFGDTTTQTFTAPPFTHQYADTGSHIVKLTVKDNDGCVDEYILADTLKVTSPKAHFSAAQTMFCPGIALPFTDSSNGEGLTYLWDFGDGQTATDANTTHQYADGKYTVKLLVRDSQGCEDSLIRTDYIEVITPVAAFVAEDTSSTCQLLETKFFNKSEHYESFHWDFGDSTQSTLAEPKHFYDVYGNYVMKLYVKGYGGCIDSAVGQVNVYDPYLYTKINYNVPPFACNEMAVEFNVTTPPGTKFQFIFGDGTIDSSGQTTLQHNYIYPNNYRPTVFLKDSLDCQVNVGGPTVISVKGAVPAFNIDERKFCDSGTIFVTNYSISNEPIVAQVWDFGDMQTSLDKNPPAHTYPQPGLYSVSLTATTSSGCEKTFYDTVRVFRTPNPVIAVDDITCINRMIAFNGTLVQPDTAIQWNWNFGDGKTSIERNNNISYSNPGNYSVTLTAANMLGCKNTTTLPLTVAPLPVITLQNVIIPVGGEIVLPVSYSSGISSYTWTPPEGLSCTNCPAPLAKPKFTTTYHIQVTDSNTCVNAADIMVEVVCKAENYFVPNTFSPNGDGMNEVFYPRGRGLASVQSMKIYNRWGQLVFDKRNFSANDPTMGWNGKMGNQSVPPDVYVYMVEFVCENAQIVLMKGNVTLIR